ncbi:MAG: iron ABC transporter permease [Alphaproteobacteria bacterium]|nr:iron ABC transporter permease [Alphaproteobacteria bacterium]
MAGGIVARLRHFDPTILIWLAIAAVLILLVVNPLFRLILTSLQDPVTGALTFDHYIYAYGRQRHLTALLYSLWLGLAVAAISVVLAVPIAWAVSRTDMPGKGATRILLLGAFITPPYLGAISWILLAGPNAGWLNQVWRFLTGAEAALVNVYTFWGLVIVIALYSFPYVFIFTTAALDVVSSEMEDAANILGAGKWQTTFRITLPLVLPAILGGAMVTFLEAIALFGTPALIGLPARFTVVTTQLYQFFSHPVRVEAAAAYAMPLLLVTVLLFWVQQRLLRRKGFVALTGKGGERRPIRLGRWRWALLGHTWLVLSLAVILPYAVLAQAAFAKAWGQGFSFGNLTLANFGYLLFEHQSAARSVLNSFTYGAATAFLAIGLGLAVAYIAVRRLVPFARVLSFLAMAPFVIPGIVLAIGFYAAYAPPPLSLYGTSTILILAFATRFLPIAYANSAAAVRALNPEMEDAVRILGGTRMTAIRRVVAPLLKQSLVGAWLLVFIPATRELSTALFLSGPNTRVMSVMLFDLSEEGKFEHLSALGLMLLVVTVVIVAVGYRVIGRDFMLRQQGSG